MPPAAERSFYETKQNPGIAAGNASDTLAQRKRLCRRFDHGDRAGHVDRGQSVPGGQRHRAVLAAGVFRHGDLRPVYVTNGTVITADNAKITNNSKTGAVQVTAISVTDGAYKVSSYNSFSGSKTIALKINSCVTKGAGKMSITKDAFPKIGAAQNLPLTYFAKVSGDAPNSKDVQAANVVFTISIVG